MLVHISNIFHAESMTDVNMELKFYRKNKDPTANGKRQTVKPGILPEPFPVSRLNGGEYCLARIENAMGCAMETQSMQSISDQYCEAII